MLVRAAWLLLPLLALVEVLGHAIIRAHVPEPKDYRAAAAFVRARLQAGDALTIAPAWADPLLREQLGDRIPLAMAGRSDLSAYKRLWALSIRGHRPPEVADRVPAEQATFGRVTVLRYALAPPRVTYDFVAHTFDAQVTLGGKPCRERRATPGRGGGLGKATVLPARRFECRSGHRRRFVAPVVLEDLSLAPRYCIYQPAQPGGPLRLRFADVPLADELVLYGGLYYEDERKRQGAPVDLRVLIDGQERAHMHHRDGDGWVRLAVDTRAEARKRAEVAVEVQSAQADKRRFCWAGSVREAP